MSVILNGNVQYELNRLAREQLKLKLLSDILLDMEICKLEGWSVLEYTKELHQLLDDILKLTKEK